MHLRNMIRLFCATSTLLGAFYQSPALAAMYTTFDPPGSVLTKAYGINPSGQIVGGYVNGTGLHGYLLSGGVFTTVDPPGVGVGGTEAVDINPQGVIVGYYFDASSRVHGYLFSGGVFSTIADVPGALPTVPQGINRINRPATSQARIATATASIIVLSLAEEPLRQSMFRGARDGSLQDQSGRRCRSPVL